MQSALRPAFEGIKTLLKLTDDAKPVQSALRPAFEGIKTASYAAVVAYNFVCIETRF